MTSSKLALGLSLLVTSISGAAHAADAPLKDAYLHYALTHQAGGPLQVKASLEGAGPPGQYGYARGYKPSRVFTFRSLTPRGEAATMRYVHGDFSSVGYEGEGHAHGFVTAVASKTGIVAVNTSTRNIAMGTKPTEQMLVSLGAVKRSTALRNAAAKAGLSTKSMTVKVSDASLSDGYRDRTLMTLGFTAHVKDAAGKTAAIDMSTKVKGAFNGYNPKLAKSSPLEHGITSFQGWQYPPSVKVGR